ncbi:MAG: histidine kinase, partial [Acidobacteriota bacterium]
MPSKPSTGSVTATASVPEAIRRGLSRITFRLLAFNLLLVFLPALGILSLRTYEAHLLDLQERSMVQQGRILAAALGGNEELVAGKAERILVNLNQQQESRLRIVDHEYQLLADSSRLGPRSTDDPGEIDSDAEPEVRSRRLYQLGTLLYRGYSFIFGVDRASDAPPRPSTLISSEGRLESPELALALDGRYGGAIRPSPTTRSLILYSALPITSGDEVIGAVLVSRSTLGILEALYDFRLSVFQVITASVAAAIVLSLLMAT